ncbi:MAG: TrmH family RNA methyltransferase [Patescibacteria group bacterium]|nr:TrmH family RNA methyltransferase [Patescibacteria group bacterium]MDD5566633.1 TrmH family RNA methyltransferase [Patescibacteria group bacterium]
MNKKEIVLVLHNVRSRFNVGAIFRTADGAGVAKIFLCGITPRPPHDKIAKVSLGAEKYIPWEYYLQTVRLLKNLKKLGYQVVALEQSRKSLHYNKCGSVKPVALVVGNEISGLPATILNLANQVIEIPMHGQKESLNVAVATGIVLFNMINTR